MNEISIIQMYQYVRDAVASVDKSFSRSVTKDLIVHLVGQYGLDILERAKFITPTEYPDTYVLSCEAKGE